MSAPSVFDALASLIRPYAEKCSVKSDTDANFYLEESRSTGKPQMFAAVQAKKSYVSFHLYPVYLHPKLIDGVSSALRARMQGKSCFNFTRVDQIPAAELTELVEAAYQATVTPAAGASPTSPSS
nr:hypothetical protein [uncultured Brevundimonas sp.]